MRNILLKIYHTSGAKIYAMMLGIITLSITARWLGTDGRGVVATITTWVLIFIDIGEMSLSTAIIFNATKQRSKDWLTKMMGALTLHTLIVTLLSWTIIALFYFAGGSWGIPDIFREVPLIPLLIGFFVLPFLLWENFTRSLLNVEDELHIFNKYQVIGSTLNSIAVALLVIVAGLGVVGVFLSKLLWQLTVAWGGIAALLKKKVGTLKLDKNAYKDILSDGAKMHLNIIGAAMLTHVDVIMVSAYLGNEQTGIYQLAVQTSLMMMIVPYSVMTVVQGEMSREGVRGVWPHQKKLLFLTLAFMIAASLFVGYTAQWWLIWLAGDAFKEAVIIFQYLLVWIVIATATAILSVQWIGRGYLLQLSLVSIATGLINVVLNSVFIPEYGIMGAVWATLCTAVFALLVNIGMYIFVEVDMRKTQPDQSN